MKTLMFVTCLFLSAGVFAAESFQSLAGAAHQAYLAGRGDELLENIKIGLEKTNNDPVMVKNLMQLYRAGLQNKIIQGGKVGWSLPKEITYLKMEAQRRYYTESGKVAYFLSATGGVTNNDLLEDFQVIQYPNKIVIDKKTAKAGSLDYWSDKGKQGFWIIGERSKEPLPEGLYLLNIKIKDQSLVQGWFIFANANATASPVIESPGINQKYLEAQPTFYWKQFKSPEYNSNFEKRTMHIKVTQSKVAQPDVQILKVDLAPTRESFQVGDKTASVKDYEGAETLTPGNYNVNVSYQEKLKLGDLVISRFSTTKVPFSVQAK